MKLKRQNLIQAAEQTAAITGLSQFFFVGLTTTLVTAPHRIHVVSDDVDLFTPEAETKDLDKVITELGEGSRFHHDNGFYVERVGSWTLLTQPPGWEERAVTIPHPTLRIQILGLMDLIFNKLDAAREKDLVAVADLLREKQFSRKDFADFLASTGTDSKLASELLTKLDLLSHSS